MENPGYHLSPVLNPRGVVAMGESRLLTLFNALMLAALVALPQVLVAASSIVPPPAEGFYERFYSPVESSERIMWPTWAYPAVVEPGGEVRVNLSFEASEASAFIINVSTGERVELEFQGLDEDWEPLALGVKGPTTLVFRVPSNAPEGMYNLYVEAGGVEAWMPRAVLVSRGPERLVILHVSDPQLGASNRGIVNDAKLARYVVAANTLVRDLGVNLVVATGDIADIGTQAAAYRSIYFSFNQVLVPTLIAPGNHDWAQVPSREAFLERFFGKYIVPARSWAWVWGDYAVIGLDTGSRGFFDEEVLSFLDEMLERLSDKKVILAFHHPLFSRPGSYKGDAEQVARYMYGSWRDNFEAASRFLELINEHKNVVAVLAGHLHRDADVVYERRDGSKVYFITTTTMAHGYPEGYYWGAKVVVVEPTGEVRVVSLDREYSLRRGSINFEPFNVYTTVSVDGRAQAWVYDTRGFEAFDVSRAVVTFILDASAEPQPYSTRPGALQGIISSADLVHYRLYVAEADLRGEGVIALAAYIDREPPTITVAAMIPATPSPGGVLTVSIRVEDAGWGVVSVEAWLVKPTGEKEELPVAMGLKRGEYIVRARLPEAAKSIIVEAVDAAGNRASYEIELGLGVERREPVETVTEQPPREETTPAETPAGEETPVGAQTPETPAVDAERPEETAETAGEQTAQTARELVTETATATAVAGALSGSLLVVAAAVIAALIIIAAAVLRARSRA